MAASDPNSLEYLRVYDSDSTTKFYQLIAKTSGLVFESVTENGTTVNWQAALKSDFAWKLLGVYDNITSEAKDIATIPHGFTDVLLFVGYPNVNNSSQVYGGKSYIIPALESGNNIVYEKELYDADGVETCGGFYAYLTNYTLRARAKKTPIRLRVYYR